MAVQDGAGTEAHTGQGLMETGKERERAKPRSTLLEVTGNQLPEGGSDPSLN